MKSHILLTFAHDEQGGPPRGARQGGYQEERALNWTTNPWFRYITSINSIAGRANPLSYSRLWKRPALILALQR
ncbi:MAG: hypothetical protein ACI8W1_002054 [Candidatus Azotimanducaceae bacterium]|jgi:hypothetical protein